MPKKKTRLSGQFSLLELIPDCIENLRQENEKEEAYTRRMLEPQPITDKENNNEHREQLGSRPDSNESNGQGDIQLVGRNGIVRNDNSLENFGQMGVEQSGETERTGEERERRNAVQSVRSTGGTGIGSEGNGTVLGFDRQRNEPLGSFENDGDRNRIVENYVITDSDNIGIGTPKQKFRDNINALKVLYTLRKNNADTATKEEQAILVKYVGWGGLPQVFDEQNQDWQNEYNELKALLTERDYEQARRSTQDAHFTPKNIIDTIYQGLRQFGVKEKVQVLEPAAGIGNFIGFKPQDFNAEFTTIEQDIISAEILNYLYPKERKFNIPFQDTLFKNPYFDVTVGNPPFGQTKLYDRNFPQLDFSMHNYFIAKSMELVKEGGLGAFVVSRYFLDSKNSEHREFIAENSHFLGAIRLPNTAFKQNALTEVTTDIVFFQKKTEQEKQNNINKGYANWVNVGEKEFESKTFVKFLDKEVAGTELVNVNKYFIDNPEQVVGSMELISGRFGQDLACIDNDGLDITAAMQKALQQLPRNIFDNSITKKSLLNVQEYTEAEKRILASERFKKLKLDSLIDGPNGKIYKKRQNELGEFTLHEVPIRYSKDVQRLSGLIQIRDNLRTLFELEKSPDNNEAEIEKYRKRLNISYDSFIKKFGLLNSQKNRSVFSEDPEATLVQALEVDYDKGVTRNEALKEGIEERAASAKKAGIFSKRVFYFIEPAKTAETSKEALLISLREKGTIDFEHMARLVGKSEQEVKQELVGTLIFENPQTQKFEVADKYLTGNIRKKLSIAQKAAENNPQYEMNVQALERAMPKDIEPADISVRFGSTWIPESDVRQFITEVISEMTWQSELHYVPEIGKWTVNIKLEDYGANKFVFGTEEYPATKIIKSLLENTQIKVMKDTGEKDDKNKPIKILDTDATAAAMEKAEKIQEAFKNWIWNDEDRRRRLAKIYNETFNTHVPVQYDGSHVELVGASYGIQLREHQKNAIWRAMQEGTALYDHVVGAGKTFEAVGTIMESKRLGFIKKPIITVPNHLVYQWRDEFYKLYPDANILVADKKDFLTQNRERFFGKIATGEWDAVIVPHSSFKKIEMPKEFLERFYSSEIANLEDALLNIDRGDSGNKTTVKQLEKRKERLREKMKKVLEGDDKSKNIDFSELGVDALFVDEAHEFKNLGITTSLSVSGLGNIAGSDKALDLYVKCRYIQEQNNGKGIYFLTGTPISNTIAEVYNMQRYLQTDLLEEKGIIHFDAWASTFGRISSNWELDATGVNYALKSRFATFDNVPELLSMYRTFADVVTRSDIEEQQKKNNERSLTPPLLGGKPINVIVERSLEQEQYMNQIIHRMEHLPKNPKIDNPLKITNDARKAGLDYRLINPFADDFANSKVNACADKIYQIWQDTEQDKGTQLVFCDLSTPKGVSKQDLENPKDDDEEQDKSRDESNDEEDYLDMDELLSLASNFSVYDDLKKKLVAKGIPEKEIAFIHDAKTDLKKEQLFSDVNKGKVRVLLGSTQKMGSGMNVQERLVAAHHLDAPWRPSDLEQRNGRIIRQGNELYKKDPDNFKIQIYNYATKQTYDARMWQCIEYKSAAIEQFRKGDVLQRSIEDIQSESANAAEMKAAASGNPLILLEVAYKAEVKKLEAQYNQFLKRQHSLEDRIHYLEKADERIAVLTQKHDNACMLRDKNKIEKPEIMIDGKKVTSENAQALAAVIKDGIKETQMLFTAKPKIGVYRGFDIFMQNAPRNGEKGFKFVLSMPGGGEYSPQNLAYTEKDDLSLSGFFTRLDNFLNKGLDEEFQKEKSFYENEKKELATIKSLRGAGFEQADELEVAKHNHNAVLRELNYMRDCKDYVPKFKPLTVEEHRANKVKEQTLLQPKKLMTMNR